MAFGLSAQTLVFHENDGGQTVVPLPADMHIEASSGVVTFTSGSARVDIPLGAVKVISFRGKKGDVNEDMTVDVADIATILTIMSGKGDDTEPETPEEPEAYTTCPDDHHPHMIDLGLPSGTKWACCNVGASKPEDYGNYYAWGETQTKEVYTHDSYQHYQDGNYVDIGSDIAGTGYDAATANWGAPWRMPSEDQIEELVDNTTSTWTTQNGVNGMKFIGSNGGTVFFPAAGYRSDTLLRYQGTDGYCWSATVYLSYSNNARRLYFNSGGVSTNIGYRRCGQSVRPVR